MSRPDLNELLAFLAVAREGSFTRAAATLGVSQSALSQTVRKLEERLGVRLLSRTTRSVSTTPAGERLANTVGPHFDGIETEVDALTALQDKPAGTVRITCGEAPLRNLLLPRLAPLVRDYPDIVLEFDVNYGLRDIVAERFDAGVRLGSMIDKDMIAARLGPPGHMAVVASTDYLDRWGRPRHPRELTAHRCINQRMVSSNGLYVWDFEKRGEKVKVRVDGPLIFNTSPPQIDAALAGLGLALLPDDEVASQLESGALVRVLEDWCPQLPGYFLYYPSRRQPSPAFALVLKALRQEHA